MNTKDFHAFEIDQDPFFESCDDHLQSDEPQETKIDSTPSVHTPIPCKIPNRYKLLILPPISHAFQIMTYIYQDLMGTTSLLRDMY